MRTADVIQACLFAGALIVGGLCIGSLIGHEPGSETIEIDSDSGSASVDSLSMHFAFTGGNADIVRWDFGDGTSAEAVEVFKVYDSPGSYTVTCTASDGDGSAVCTYDLTVTDGEYGIADGYIPEITMIAIASIMLISSGLMRRR